MNRESTPPAPITASGVLFYQSEDGTSRIEVRLPQVLITELYQTTKQNIFEEGELQPDSVVKESLTTAADGLTEEVGL